MDSNHRSLAGGSPLLGLLTSRTRPRPAAEAATLADIVRGTLLRRTHRRRKPDSNPRSPREDVKGQGPPFHADYPPTGWARKQHMKRMPNGFKRYGITCPAKTRCQPDRLI
jgi:hypothetical protein